MLSLEYIAGFFDGEGTIGVYKTNGKNHWDLTVKISQQNPEIIVLIYAQFPEAKFQPGHTVWEVRFYGENSRRFLELIKPYAICKLRQIELALSFLNCGNREEIARQLKEAKITKSLGPQNRIKKM